MPPWDHYWHLEDGWQTSIRQGAGDGIFGMDMEACILAGLFWKGGRIPFVFPKLDWEDSFHTILYILPYSNVLIEGSLEVKLPTIWTDGKAEVRAVRERVRREEVRRERVSRKKIQVHEKVEESRNTVFFQYFVAPEGQKVGSLKWRVQSHLVRWEIKFCTPLWREAHFDVRQLKTCHCRTYESWAH